MSNYYCGQVNHTKELRMKPRWDTKAERWGDIFVAIVIVSAMLAYATGWIS